MKKKLLAGASLALSAVLLTACNTVNQKLEFNTNWALNTLIDTPISSVETLTYDVDFDAASFFQEEYYQVAYCKDIEGNKKLGVYETRLEGKADGYLYTTTLTLPVVYTFGGASTLFEDTGTSTVEFRTAQKSLEPIKSTKRVVCHSPVNAEPTKAEGCYVSYDYEVIIEYNADCTGGTMTQIDYSAAGTLYDKAAYPNGKTTNFEIDKETYSYLDNEQLLFALRGLSNTEISSAQKVNVYNASTKIVETVSVTPSSTDSEKFSFTINGTPIGDTPITYTPVSISTPLPSIFASTNTGAAQELHYAQTVDPSLNTYRNVMLYMEVPVAYNIGSLTYKLKNAVFAN